MMLNLSTNQQGPTIKVIGLGGGGANAVAAMKANDLAEMAPGIEFCVMDTDISAINHASIEHKTLLGEALLRGLSSGADPARGRAAAEESLEAIKVVVGGVDMVFIIACMGGGTGTGAAPVVARCAKETGALTVGVVTRPFHVEGPTRLKRADKGLGALNSEVDTLFLVDNQRFLSLKDEAMMFFQAFIESDWALIRAVRGIYGLVSESECK